MASFAELNENNEVINVIGVYDHFLLDEEEVEKEELAINKLKEMFGPQTRWVQTSYNTQGGVHLLGKTPLRKNFAGIGYTYDPDRDAFIPPQPDTNWTLNEETCNWNKPE